MQTKEYAHPSAPVEHAVPGAPPHSGWWLWITDAGASWWHELRGETVRLGRSHSADVHLEHASVSQRHAIIARAEGRWWLHDDRALNVPLVNGDEIAGRRRLASGDLVELGATRITVIGSAD